MTCPPHIAAALGVARRQRVSAIRRAAREARSQEARTRRALRALPPLYGTAFTRAFDRMAEAVRRAAEVLKRFGESMARAAQTFIDRLKWRTLLLPVNPYHFRRDRFDDLLLNAGTREGGDAWARWKAGFGG